MVEAGRRRHRRRGSLKVDADNGVMPGRHERARRPTRDEQHDREKNGEPITAAALASARSQVRGDWDVGCDVGPPDIGMKLRRFYLLPPCRRHYPPPAPTATR